MKKKHKIIILLVAIFIILCIPVLGIELDDGGTVGYRAVLYCVWDKKTLWTNDKNSLGFLPDVEENAEGYLRGIEIEILGKIIYSNLRFEERTDY